MNTTQLKYALEIQKTGSITAAAQNLYLSQPNLSKAIKELEAEINMKIFQRSSKGVVPTREGKTFLENAAVIYEQMMNFDAMYTAKRGDDVNLTLCIPRAIYKHGVYRLFEHDNRPPQNKYKHQRAKRTRFDRLCRVRRGKPRNNQISGCARGLYPLISQGKRARDAETSGV